MDKTRVRAVITKNGKYLLVKSNEEHNHGTWQFAGGNAESEDLLSEIKREIKEELGAGLTNPKFAFTIRGRRGNVHYFTGKLKGKIKLQKSEIADYGWFDYNSAKKLSLSNTARQALQRLKNEIHNL